MKKATPQSPSRRKALKILGAGALAAGAGSWLAACATRKDGTDSDASTGEMTYRVNPSTGDKVSILGYGCMRYPTVPDTDGVIDQEAVNESIDHALAHGVNYFDTSPAYCKGQSETATGIALSRHPRHSYFIATKLSNFDESTWSKEKSMEIYNNSFKNLQVDYIDYLLLHGIGMGSMEAYNGRYEDNGMLDFLISEREKGKIRNLGFSYHGDIAVFDHLLKLHDEGRLKWDFCQIQLNYVDWLHAKEVNDRNTNGEYLYGELKKRNIPAVIMEPLLGGRLASLPDNLAALLKKERPDDPIAKWAFRYAGTPEGVLTVLSGMTYMEHLRENIATYSPLEPITEEEDQLLQRVATMMLQYPIVNCTQCSYCMPCPYGLDIPGIFNHYNKMVNSGSIVLDRQDPFYAKARRDFLVGLSRKVEQRREPGRCIDCKECLTHCPQGIQIPEEMARIHDYTETLRRNPEA